MPETEDEHIYHIFRDKLEKFELPYNPEHWDHLKGRLEHTGKIEKYSNSSRRFNLRRLLSIAFILLMTALFFVFYKEAGRQQNNESSYVDNKNKGYDLKEKEAQVVDDYQNDSQESEIFISRVSPSMASEIYESAQKADTLYLSVNNLPFNSNVFAMNYGSSDFLNRSFESPWQKNIKRIQLLYTKYPPDIDFDQLNKNRIRAFLKTFPQICKAEKVKWEIIAQTGANSKSEAEKYFHGFIVTYDTISDVDLYDTKMPVAVEQVYNISPSLLTKKPYKLFSFREKGLSTFFIEQKIKNIIANNIITGDSTAFKVLERNINKWRNAVVVCDWTSSMFKYGSQVMPWLAAHKGMTGIKGFVFFTDCDVNGEPISETGAKGAMFYVKGTRTSQILDTMLRAVRKGTGNKDLKENDAEAIHFALQQFPEVDEIILIAENASSVRDMYWIDEVSKPVRIIVCGATLNDDQAIQQDYFTIAQRTKGSIHTIENDLEAVNTIKKGTIIKVGKNYFKYKNMKFKPVRKAKSGKKKSVRLH